MAAEAEIPALGGRVAVTRSRIPGLAPAHGFVYVFRSLERERAVEEAARRSERLTALGRLVSGITHELNNPLASIMACAQLLAAELGGRESTRELVETLLEEARRSREVLRTLAAFARPGEPREQVLDAVEAVHTALRLRQADLAARDVTVHVEAAGGPHLVVGDPAQIQQVLFHLIANADEAMIPSSPAKALTSTPGSGSRSPTASSAPPAARSRPRTGRTAAPSSRSGFPPARNSPPQTERPR